MLPNHEGQQVPEVTLTQLRDGKLQTRTTQELFAGKTVVVFSLPGAFTPTCSTAHVPRFGELASAIKAQGVDAIYCLSVNDAFVMDAWARAQEADQVEFLADGNGAFTEGMGLLVDKSQLGFGKRSWRYSMLVRDGKVEKMFIEPEVEGDPYEVSDADTMLDHLAPGTARPDDIVLFTKPGCRHCARAKQALEERSLGYAEVSADLRLLRAVSGAVKTPQVFVNGALVGGADELIARLES